MKKDNNVCNNSGEILVKTWWKCGEMLYNRYALSPDHPEYIYNYIKREFNVDPEDYGIEKPKTDKICPHCNNIIEKDKK